MKRLFPVICFFACFIAVHSFAGSATWTANPTSNDWNTADNWTPATVPNGAGDVASFGTSTITDLTLSSAITIGANVYDADADGFTISSAGPATLTFAGDGIVNTSATLQNFVADTDKPSGGLISFTNSATISGPVNFTVKGGICVCNPYRATLEFHDNSSAGTGSFVCEPPQVSGAGNGQISFFDSASAGTGQFTCEGTVVENSLNPAAIYFNDSSTAGDGTFIANAGNSFGGAITFLQSATAGHGTFTINGSGGAGGFVLFMDTTDAGDATFILNGSDVDYGGRLHFENDSTPGNSTIIINSGELYGGECTFRGTAPTGAPSVSVFGTGTSIGNGTLNIELNSGSTSIGSLEGNGYLFLVQGTLMIGTNNRSTEFDGPILAGGSYIGSLTKVGTGTLTLTGANTYTGVTTILSGGLKINNTAGSGTGTAAVKVSGATLSGRGIISGKVTVGTGSSAGAVIAPSQGAGNPATLTLQNMLTFKADGSYLYRLNTKKATADQVIANGVKIESGAQFNFKTVGNKKLTTGTVFTAISNTATTPISGTFANLADGATVTLGRNKLQASYSGGDGNDLTLTVVP